MDFSWLELAFRLLIQLLMNSTTNLLFSLPFFAACATDAVTAEPPVVEEPPPVVEPPAAPVANLVGRWTFEDGTARDDIRGAEGVLENGARIVKGALVLDGVDDHAVAPLTLKLAERTLVAWVSVFDLDQRGGGALTVQTADGAAFDSIVYGETISRQWRAGSDFGQRSVDDNAGELETSTSMVMMAIAYGADNSITIYRDGELYAAHTAASLNTYDVSATGILIGQRHTGGASAHLAGAIEEARMYSRALSIAEVQQLAGEGPVIGNR
jgi:hypothetical protein